MKLHLLVFFLLMVVSVFVGNILTDTWYDWKFCQDHPGATFCVSR